MASILPWMIKAPHRFVLLAALLLPLGCKQKTTSDKPLPLAQLETALARLDQRYQQSEVPEQDYRTRRQDLKGELIGIMKQLARAR